MKQPSCARRPALFLVAAVSVAASAAAAECVINHRFAAPRAETLLAVSPTGHQAVVTPGGGLRYADGVRIDIAPTGELAFPRNQPSVQRLLDGRSPIVVTTRESNKLALELSAFASPSPPMDCLRAVVRNKTAAPLSPIIRIQVARAHATLTGPHAGFQRDGELLALCEVREGKAKVVGAVKPKRYVFHRRGGKVLPQWGKPKVPCDRGFRNIVAGFSEPATYRLKIDPAKRYIVAVGLCESHWKTPGNRICDILIEGKKVATIDPVKKPYRPDVPFALTFPAADRNRDGWLDVTSVANPASPDPNSIINVIWLLKESVGKEIPATDIVAGKANQVVHCYVDCGGPVEAPGPTTLDYQLELPPNGSATLWLKKPRATTRVADAPKLAAVDLSRLLQATEQAWKKRLSRGATVEVSDPAPANLLYASFVNLLALCAPAGDGLALSPGPLSSAFSPEVAARGAVALDRMGAHAEAAQVLANLVARRGDDRLWHSGADAWSPTGQVLWALVSHYELTSDKKWLGANYRAILSAAEALIEARELTKWIEHDPASIFHSLMPIAPYRGLPSDHWFVHALWAWHGIGFAAKAARALEKPNDYLWLEDNLADFTSCIRRSLAQSRVTGSAAGCLPAAAGETPLWSFASCTAALSPAHVLPPDDKLVAATFRYLDGRSVEHLPGGIDGRSALVDVPLACDYALCRLVRGDGDGALAAFASIANIASPTGAFPDQADLRARRAGGLSPSAAAAAGYILLLREMLVSERGEELHLCPCVPRTWLSRGLSVTNLPTTFGPLSFRATLAADGRKLVVQPRLKARRWPKSLIVHPPRPAGRTKPASTRGWKGTGKIEVRLD